MSHRHVKSEALLASDVDLVGANYKLTLVSTLLFYIARSELDLSSDALMGMSIIVDEIANQLRGE